MLGNIIGVRQQLSFDILYYIIILF